MYHLINTGFFRVFSPYDLSTSQPTDLHQAHPVGLVETSQKTANRETHPRYQVSPTLCRHAQEIGY
jgi:hypothetical protein